jgi:hypothetical protein
VVVGNLDIMGVAVPPAEAEAPLIVDADGVLPIPIPGQLFQAIARRNAQVLE